MEIAKRILNIANEVLPVYHRRHYLGLAGDDMALFLAVGVRDWRMIIIPDDIYEDELEELKDFIGGGNA